LAKHTRNKKKNNQLSINAIHYSPNPANIFADKKKNHKNSHAFVPNLIELTTNCKLAVNCYGDNQKEYRNYTHEDLVVLFPGYAGYLKTYMSILLGDGFTVVGGVTEKNQAKQKILDKLLQTQTRAGTLNLEEIEQWIQEYVERKTSILFVDKDGFEHLDTTQVEVVELSVEESVSWNTDVAGILYFLGEKITNIPETIKIKYATIGTIRKLVEYQDVWYIPKENLVILGEYANVCHQLSIFDSDRARIQYIVESNRLAVDELSRDKIPPLILKMRALSPRDRATALGVNPALLDTPDGSEIFLKELIMKIGQSKEAVAKNLLTDPQQGKVSILDMAVYEDILPLPTNSSYQDDLTKSEEMAKQVMSNLLGIPSAILGSKSDNFSTAIKALLQFTQDTLIKRPQGYINFKLLEVANKFGWDFGIEIQVSNLVDATGQSEIEKTWIESARQLIGFGTPIEDVNKWLTEKIGIVVRINDNKERFTDSSLVPYVDSSLTEEEVGGMTPSEETDSVENDTTQDDPMDTIETQAESKSSRKKPGIHPTII